MRKKLLARRVLALSIVGAACVAPPALAATETDDMEVSLTVTASCTIAVDPLDFGSIGTLTTGASPVDASAAIDVTCTSDADYQVGLDLGGNADDDQRRLRNTGATNEYLNYGLFTENATYTDAWGDTLDTDTVVGTGSSAEQTLTVYGRIPAGQAVSLGAYTDSVTATIWYGL